ncbi:uncharacterized protein C1orf21 homolog, partial [Podarcis muralis]
TRPLGQDEGRRRALLLHLGKGPSPAPPRLGLEAAFPEAPCAEKSLGAPSPEGGGRPRLFQARPFLAAAAAPPPAPRRGRPARGSRRLPGCLRARRAAPPPKRPRRGSRVALARELLPPPPGAGAPLGAPRKESAPGGGRRLQDEYRIKPVEEVKYMKNGGEDDQKIAARNQENLEKSATSHVRLKPNKELPGLVHQPRANMHISESQQEFFRMLDEKIEKKCGVSSSVSRCHWLSCSDTRRTYLIPTIGLAGSG